MVTPRRRLRASDVCPRPRAPYALALEADHRSLPQRARGSGPGEMPAGLQTACDVTQPMSSRSLHDIGLRSTSEHGPRRSSVFQASGTAALTSVASPRTPLVPKLQLQGSDLAFSSSKRPWEEENPQTMRRRGLRSNPKSFGFIYPRTTVPNDDTLGTKIAVACSEIALLTAADESFPRNHSVLQAQYQNDGVFHAYSNTVGV